MPAILLGNKRLYVELYGHSHNPAVVYFHGGPGASCLDFRAQAENLSQDFYVISFDQFGVLRSGRPDVDKPFGMAEHLKLVENLRDTLNIESWSVIGHSYGGMLACLYAYTYEKSVEKVIYECPSLNFPESEKSIASYCIPFFESRGDADGAERCKAIIEKDYSDCVETVFSDVIHVLNKIDDSKKRNYLHGVSYEEYSKHMETSGLDESLWDCGMHVEKLLDEKRIYDDFLPLLAKNKQPSLLICGKYDPVCTENHVDCFVRNAQQGTVLMFENSGHFPRIEEPLRYYAAVSEFLHS